MWTVANYINRFVAKLLLWPLDVVDWLHVPPDYCEETEPSVRCKVVLGFAMMLWYFIVLYGILYM